MSDPSPVESSTTVDEIRLSEHDDAVEAAWRDSDDAAPGFARQRSATRAGLSAAAPSSASSSSSAHVSRSALRSASGRRSEEECVDEGDESAADDSQHSAREPGAAADSTDDLASSGAPTTVVVEEGHWCEDEESAAVYPSPHTRARASRISPTSQERSGGSLALGRQRSSQRSSKTDAELPSSATFSSERIAEPAVRAMAAMNSAALPVAINPAHAVRERFVDPRGAAAACLKLGHPSNHLLAAASPSASMLAVFELLLHFDTFKNIDLFRQGLYYLRCHFFTLGGIRVDAATMRANAAAAAAGAGAGGQAESVGGLGASPTASTGIASPQSANSTRSVGVGRGAADSGVDSDVGSLPRSAEEAAALQAQILQWEAAVHDLNTPIPKDKDQNKEREDLPPMPSSESLMATAGDGSTGGGSGSSGIQLKKHRLALPYYILSNPKANTGNLFAFADKAVWPPSIQDTSNTFHTRTFRMQYCEQEIVINDACLFRLELNARKRVPVYLEVELMFAEYTIADVSRGRSPPPVNEFSVASRHLYCIDDIYSEGVHGFVPLTFDDHHFCTVSTMLHTQLIDFKFRPAPREPAPSPPASAAASANSASPSPSPAPSSGSPGASPTPPLPSSPPGASPNGGLPAANTPPSPALASSSSSSLGVSSGSGNYPALASSATFSFGGSGSGSGVALAAAPEPVARPVFPKHTVAQILFPRLLLARTPRNTTPQSIMQLANDYHHLFLGALIQSYNQLARTFETYNRHCVSGLQRGALADKLAVPPLVLPANVSPNSPANSVASSLSEPGAASEESSGAGGGLMTSGIRSVSRGELSNSSSRSAWHDESSSNAYGQADSLQSRSRRSSLDHAALEHERHMSAAEEEQQLSARFATPKLFTLAYRMRSQANCCCAWDDPDRAATMILSDLQSVSQQIFTLWNGFQHMLPLASNQVAAFEQVKWEQACAARWDQFVFRESFQIEDRWRVGPINIAELHGRTVAQLRAAGLGLLWKPPPRIRDCTPSLQPAEQVLIFEERFQNKVVDVAASEAEPTRIAREGIQIIEAHFDGASSSASATNSSSSSSSKRNGNDQPRSDGASSPTEVSRTSPSLSAMSERRGGHVEEPGLSLEAEESMLNATVFSDSIGLDAAKEVRPDSRESVMGSAAARPVPVHLHGADCAPAAASGGAASSIDFDGVSARVAEASRRRRLASIAQAAAASHSTATAGPGALAARPYEGKHLVVLCHGYQGNSWDMRLLKNHLMALYPHCSFYSSTANESQTEGDIGEMGARLATELDGHLALECRELGRLSFVCHSLGGVIARAALAEPVMAPYLSKLYSYVSLATPHCGYLLSDNSMLTTGIWFLKKWTKSACLSQLSLTDSEDASDCFLSQLAKKPSLALFTHVYLLAAQADKYAPFHSARIEIHPAAIADRKKGALFHNMVGALLGQLTDPRIDLRRFDVWFLAKKKNIDSFIGRTAHINFLTETNYMQLFFMQNAHLFT